MHSTYPERNGLILARDITDAAIGRSSLEADVRAGNLRRVRRGTFVDAQRWTSSDARERHLLRIRSVMAASRHPLVFSGLSAGAVWGIPIEGEFPDDVTVLVEWPGGGSSMPGVRRTAAGFSTARTQQVGDFTVTSLTRTVLDVARESSLMNGIATLDWAISRSNPRAVSRADLAEELSVLSPRTRRRRLALGVKLATELSGSFGESQARAVIYLLGFEQPELQVEFRDYEGRMFPDFWWRSVRVAGEYDGRKKYARDNYSGSEPEQVLWLEKKREDRLRHLGVRRIERILREHVQHPSRLERMLIEAGVPRQFSSSRMH